jgi:hypothetical protein
LGGLRLRVGENGAAPMRAPIAFREADDSLKFAVFRGLQCFLIKFLNLLLGVYELRTSLWYESRGRAPCRDGQMILNLHLGLPS